MIWLLTAFAIFAVCVWIACAVICVWVLATLADASKIWVYPYKSEEDWHVE